MIKGRTRLTPRGNGLRTVHWVVDDAPLCGRTSKYGLDLTEDAVTCSWCARKAANPAPPNPHQPKRVCAECGGDWPCSSAAAPVGAVRDWYLLEIGKLMQEAGS